MKQIAYHIKDFSDGSFESMLEEVAGTSAYTNAAQVLLVMFEQNWEVSEIKRKTSLIKSALPKAEIAGITHYDEIVFGGFPNHTVFNFIFFDRPSFDIYVYDALGDRMVQVGRQINETLQKTEALRAVMMFGSWVKDYREDTLLEASKGFEDIPFFGGIAGISTIYARLGGTAYVFDEKGVYEESVIAIVFHGEKLFVKVSYNFGWSSVGKYMTVTGLDNPYCITTIDGYPAADIYEKYLGVDYVDKPITGRGLAKFPITVERDGVDYFRVTQSWDNDGRLYFPLPFELGDKIRFSYGVPINIIDEIRGDRDTYLEFVPQAMLLSVCINRLLFLKEHERDELDYFLEHGGAEIYKQGSFGGVLNSALVVFAMREGKVSEYAKEILKYQIEMPRPRPNLVEFSVSNFVEAITNDLEEMSIRANVANEAKSNFLSIMSQEIRTPINAVIGMNEMILRESREANIREYARDIQNAGSTLLALINDILDFSNINSGTVAIKPVQYGLAGMIRDIIQMISIKAKSKGLDLRIYVDDNIPSVLYGDDIRIKQILTNILTNAVKYTEEGRVELRLSGKGDGEDIILHFEIEDTGVGIKQDDMPKLLEAFSRLDEERNRHIEGTGLGMTITVNLLRMMGSELKIESEYGRGSVFSFDLRQKIIKDEPVGNYEEQFLRPVEEQSYERSFHAPGARALVADENKMNLKVFEQLLKQNEIQVTCVTNVEDCLELSAKERFDVIFIDHMMFGMDPIETINKLKKNKKGNVMIPIVALQSNMTKQTKKLYEKEGFAGYIEKPIIPIRLEELLVEILPEDLVIREQDEMEVRATDNSESVGKQENLDRFDEIEGFDFSYARMLLPRGHILMELVRDFVSDMDTKAKKLDNIYIMTFKIANTIIGSEKVMTPKEIVKSGIKLTDRVVFEDALENYRMEARSMKSSAASVGSVMLAGMANRLELAARDYELKVLVSMHKVFIDTWLSYREKLEEYL